MIGRIAPSGILFWELQRQIDDDLSDSWSSRRLASCVRVVPFIGDSLAMPSQNRIGNKQRSHFGKSFVAENFAFDCHPATLFIGEQDAALSKLLSEYRILGSQILNHLLLLTMHPAGDHDQGELPRLEDKIHDSPMRRKSMWTHFSHPVAGHACDVTSSLRLHAEVASTR